MVTLLTCTSTRGGSTGMVSFGSGTPVVGDDISTVVDGCGATIVVDGTVLADDVAMTADGVVALMVGGGGVTMAIDVVALMFNDGGATMAGDGVALTVRGGESVTLFAGVNWLVVGTCETVFAWGAVLVCCSLPLGDGPVVASVSSKSESVFPKNFIRIARLVSEMIRGFSCAGAGLRPVPRRFGSGGGGMRKAFSFRSLLAVDF